VSPSLTSHAHQLDAKRWQGQELEAALAANEKALSDKEVQLAHLVCETQRLGALLQRKQVCARACVCGNGGPACLC
jgi:hypothetical protein